MTFYEVFVSLWSLRERRGARLTKMSDRYFVDLNIFCLRRMDFSDRHVFSIAFLFIWGNVKLCLLSLTFSKTISIFR